MTLNRLLGRAFARYTNLIFTQPSANTGETERIAMTKYLAEIPMQQSISQLMVNVVSSDETLQVEYHGTMV
jgi:hypothetical protein